MRVRRTLRCVVITATLVAASSCDENPGPPPEQRPFEGIREFDEDCVSIGGDTTDFMPRPIVLVDTTVVPPYVGFSRNYSLVAACPNPTRTSTTLIEFVMPQPDSVWLLVYDRTNSPPIDTLYARSSPAGTHKIMWYNPSANGIFRVEMSTRSGFRSHGDVQFTP